MHLLLELHIALQATLDLLQNILIADKVPLLIGKFLLQLLLTELKFLVIILCKKKLPRYQRNL